MREPPLLSDTDLSIIKCLSEDPRCSVAKMAQALELPESTVRHRLKRVVESGLIEFTAIVNPLQFGFHTWVIINLRVELPHLQEVGEQLAALPQVYFVGITAGGFDIQVGAVLRSTDELSEFITGPVARIRGITRISTSSVLKVLKRTSAFGVLRPMPPDAPQKPAEDAPSKRARRSNGSAAGTPRKR